MPTDPTERGDALPGRRLPAPVRRFLAEETSAAVVLLAAAALALVWANSPWRASYQALWHTEVMLSEDLQHWVNDAVMAVFFFVVGLEIKRELVQGELRDRRRAAMPAIAALGGMVVPAAIFAVVNIGRAGSRGWGIPMATDIAFAVGVVALVGARVPPSLKLFLLTLAVVDDIGAIAVIGVFYSSGIEVRFLVAALVLVGLVVGLNRAGVVAVAPYLVVGGALWLATYASGVHATIAGVALGLLMPARRPARRSVSPVERTAHMLQPWSSFLIVPVFALANAGVQIRSDSFGAPGATAVTVGVLLGLVVGKTLGIAGAVWLGARTGLGRLPAGATWSMIVAAAAVAGIGFTVSLFIAELAFRVAPLQDAARLGVLAASTVAAVVGGVALRRACRTLEEPEGAVVGSP